jgi:NAD(P)-dependent dehydrogenase (short-subunit alcohol dehydrogenase family)
MAVSEAFSIDGKVVIVTGGAMGIGAGICDVLAQAGAMVVIADRDLAAANAKAEGLRADGHSADAIEVDVTDEASVAAATGAVVERHGAPWGLVNNAGLQHRELLLDGTVEHWDRINRVNALGPFLMSREVAKAMVDAGQGGRIVNCTSAGLEGQFVQGLGAYLASKGALRSLTTMSAYELAEHGITVNEVLPGGVGTPGAIGAEGPPPVGPGNRRPLLGMVEPRDIGSAVLYFLTPAAHRVTGQRIAVDAGGTLT